MSVIAIAVQAIRDRGTIRPLAVEFILIFMELAVRQTPWCARHGRGEGGESPPGALTTGTPHL
jgi:hypothetical protein